MSLFSGKRKDGGERMGGKISGMSYKAAVRLIVIGLLVGAGINVTYRTRAAEGPVTAGSNVAVTADNGRLRVYFYASSGAVGPVTPLGNIGLKSDNGRLSVVATGGTMTPDIVQVSDGSVSAPSFAYVNSTGLGLYRSGLNTSTIILASGSSNYLGLSANFDGITLRNTGGIYWGPSSTADFGFGSQTLALLQDASNTLGLRNGTNPQTFDVYKTYTDASNYERLHIGYGGGATYDIYNEQAGTGVARPIQLFTSSTVNLNFGTNSIIDWFLQGTTGHFLANTDNTYDIGASGATRPRTGYFGTSLVSPLLTGGTATFTGKITNYNAVVTAGQGTPSVYGFNSVVAATNTGTASIATYTNGAADGSFEVACNVLVTVSTAHSFSCDVTYTDEGNTARTLVLPVAQLAGAFVANGLITNATGVGPYESPVMHIRVKASTAITVRTSAGGTFTTVTYNARGLIVQVG